LAGIGVLAIPTAAVAQAQDGEGSDAIVVTGERIARTVQQTASSVVVTTGDDLDDRAGADTINDVLAFAPNVSAAGAQNNGPTIRGQNTTGVLSGVDAFLGGSRPRTTILLDGRPLSFNEFIFGETGSWDIAQIEVFLGPQTTSQGPNSIAGIINVRTNDPVFTAEAAARAIVASSDTVQLSGMVNVPVVEGQVALRVAGDYREHNSFLDFSGTTPFDADPRKDDFKTLRAKLLVEPEALPGLRALFTYDYADSAGPQVESILVPPPGSQARVYPPYDAPVFASETHTGIADLSYAVNGKLGVSNRFTYTRGDIKRHSPPGTGVADIDRDEFTNETLLNYGKAGDPLSGVAGLYLQHTAADEFIDLAAFGLGDGIFTDYGDSLGVFGELTVSPAPQLFVTGGLRYQRDRQDRDGGFTAIPAAIAYDRAFDEWLPKLGLAYDVSDALRIGVEARRGYNPGGVTLSFFTGQVDTFDAERLWNYEVYFRSQPIAGRLSLNGNLFYTDFEDAQRPVNEVVPGIGVVTTLDNTEDARSYGAELQLNFTASKRLQLQAGLGLLGTEIRRVGDPSLEGNAFERAPGLTATLGVRAEPVDGFVLSVNGRYSDGYFSDDANDPALRVGSYFLANAQASYQLGPVRLFAFATNLFDEFALLQRFGDGTANVTDPREYGAGMEIAF
jgi:outer membrane receptor protein involved in Fe transport